MTDEQPPVPDNEAPQSEPKDEQTVEERLTKAGFRKVRGAWRR